MINRKNPTRESGYSQPFALAVTAIATCAVLAMGAVGVLAPASATPNVSTEITAVHDSSTAYFPAQYVNQAKEAEEHIQAF